MNKNKFYQIFASEGKDFLILDVVERKFENVKIEGINDIYTMSFPDQPNNPLEVITGFLPNIYIISGFYDGNHIPYVIDAFGNNRLLMNAVDVSTQQPDQNEFRTGRYFATEVR